MLIARINGGIGNQLFQYAFVRSLSIKLNQKFLLDLSWYFDYDKYEKSNDPNAATKRDFLLNYFNVKSPITNKVYLNWIKRLEIRSKNSTLFKYLLDGPLNNFSFKKIDQKNFSMEVNESTLEDWQREARKLELQGKQEQADDRSKKTTRAAEDAKGDDRGGAETVVEGVVSE